ncbi:MAG TPA: DUF1015 domain-containing protein [Bryobacteraceae bacterium]|nr:DUF1015 domain-containing protein [Bryobacteraceae bacterium]
MAKVFPFQPYRFTREAGPLEDLLTQPYDKITPEMRARYLARSPNNLVRIELGERFPSDDPTNNVYTRSQRQLDEWITSGVLAREEKCSFLPYFQTFNAPDTGERLTRKGFIGLGSVEDYEAGWIFRHERTLTGPKQDRLELLRHTRAHTGQIFMLYDDRYGEVDAMLDEAASARAVGDLEDEYGVQHTIWRVSNERDLGRIQHAMADKKLLIADGHHRYETAVAFHRENPSLAGASRVMMTFVNMQSPGLRILATHRVIHSLPEFDAAGTIERARSVFRVLEMESEDALAARWREPHRGLSRIGLALGGRVFLLETDRPADTLDVTLAEERILGELFGIGEEAIRENRNLRYVRGLEAAVHQVREGQAQAAVLLEPTPIEDVARIAFSGGVLPQKSTDFYPKLLSGVAIYRIEK